MKFALYLLAALRTPTACAATSAGSRERALPPVQYDYEFPAQWEELRGQDQEQMHRICPGAPKFAPALGCSFRGNIGTIKCLIILAPEKDIEAAGWTADIIRRHEMGHCNGWPADHSGARVSGPRRVF
jgi:hypothetical protein